MVHVSQKMNVHHPYILEVPVGGLLHSHEYTHSHFDRFQLRSIKLQLIVNGINACLINDDEIRLFRIITYKNDKNLIHINFLIDEKYTFNVTYQK